MANDALFRLIKSMSKNEKRYFKVRVNAGNNAKEAEKARIYLQLYDAINQMDNFDAKLLKKKFPSNLPAYQRQLFDAILRSMRDYQSKNSKQIQIKELIMDAKYLYERSLYDLSNRRLEDAKKLARQIDDQLALLDINKQERYLLRVNFQKEGSDAKILEAIGKKGEIIRNINEEYGYNDIYDKLSSMVTVKHELKTEEELEQLKAEYESLLFNGSPEPASPHAIRRFLQCKAMYFQLLGDRQKANQFFSKVVDWWRSNPELQKEAYYWYIIDLSNLLQNCMINDDLDLFDQVYEELKASLEQGTSQKGFNEHTQAVALHKLYLNKLSYFALTNKYEQIRGLAPEIETYLNTHKVNLRRRLILLYNVTVFFFIVAELESTRIWIEKILAYIGSFYREDLQKIALIINLICSLEEEEYLPDANSLKAADLHFKKTFKLQKNAFEMELVTYIKALARLAPFDRKGKYEELHTFLKQVSTSGRIAGLDVLTYWVESKIKRMPLLEIVIKNKGK